MYLCFFFLCVCSRCCMFVWEFPLSLTGAPVGDTLYIGICFYPPISIPPPPLLFVSCLSCLRHCHTIPHMMQYLKWHKNKWINEQMKDEQEKPIETLHSCSSKGIMCSAPQCVQHHDAAFAIRIVIWKIDAARQDRQNKTKPKVNIK